MSGIRAGQGGAGLFGVLLWLVGAVLVLTLGFKLAPSYVEFWTVKSAMNAVSQDPELIAKGRGQLMSSLSTRLEVNDVRGLPKDAIKIEQQGSGWDLVAAYEVRVPLFYNIDALLSFDYIIAERGATFGLPEVLFGLFPGMGAHAILSRKLGSAMADRLIVSFLRFATHIQPASGRLMTGSRSGFCLQIPTWN